MGRIKLLLPYGVSTILETIVTELTACPSLDTVVVVTSYEPDRIAALLATYPVQCVFNPVYARTELLVSLQVGLRALAAEVRAALIVLGDHPRLRLDTIQRVIEAYQPGALVISSYRMKRGHPILIDRVWWDEVLALPEIATLRGFVRAHEDRIRYVVMETDSVLKDVDTPEDYQSLRTADALSAQRNASTKQVPTERIQEMQHGDQ